MAIPVGPHLGLAQMQEVADSISKFLLSLIDHKNGKIEGRKITLIGGAGFIGHNLALHLQQLPKCRL